MRKINPLGFRVLVRLEKELDTTESGLYLPEGSKEAMTESVLARVTEVASATDYLSDDDTHINVSGIPKDAKVLIRKNAGVKIPWDEELRLVETEEVLALVDEVNII